MNRLMTLLLGMMFFVGLTGVAVAESLEAPGNPTVGSGMYTLQQVYDYLYTGTVPTIPGSFQETSTSPGSTMKTTKQIYEAVATPFAQCDATAEDVKQGKKFFSTQSANWGVLTGTCVTPTPTNTPTPTTTLTPTITPTPDWYTQYGPSPGSGDVVKIGTMYVASLKDGVGCGGGVKTFWATGGALWWADALVWLGKDDWRLPTKDELSTICSNKGSLGSYQSDYYWSSTQYDASHTWDVTFSDCLVNAHKWNTGIYERAVRP
ncbi:MAG: DUF1566 domain-containing protein [Candidatus Aureabacteria bacterium]|nr:DUF1566 domain-containing protein [Candidatus Auribacterota bacterium]